MNITVKIMWNIIGMIDDDILYIYNNLCLQIPETTAQEVQITQIVAKVTMEKYFMVTIQLSLGNRQYIIISKLYKYHLLVTI